VYRVSSTKSLVNTPPTRKIEKAVIYGGLEYEMNLAQLEYQHKHISTGAEYLAALKDLNEFVPDEDSERALDSLSVRGSVSYLEGTLHEVENIAEQLMQNGVNTRVYTGKDGVEETFKMLSGSDTDIIHIATHGFFFSEQELKESGLHLAFLDQQHNQMDNVLNYSGLLLSGSNYILRGNKLPQNIENGVLTAREIAQIDLGHVGLIVLSACQTGLGEIREDGVFGIQRGFKKAGAQSLLMSLWKVSDHATDLMMSQFYKFLMDGHDRHEAFSMAQQAVRKSEFTDPYFWASFVLLDAK
jgi:CHAT domain-containing protein